MTRSFSICLTVALVVFSGSQVVESASFSELQARRPDLFHAETGLRIARQRAPTPDDIPPPAMRIDTAGAARLIGAGALALDVFGALQSRYDDLDGTWLVGKAHRSIPGASWLPEVGRGMLSGRLKRYLKVNIERLTGGNREHPIVVFCVADCWMSWNGAQRIAKLGYRRVYWFALGTDGWLDSGRQLAPIKPIPVNVD